MSDNQRYYEILGITPDASLEEIKQAYKDLVHVWHPDRFSYNPRLVEKAEEKLKQINLAYEYVIAELNNPSEKREYAQQTEEKTPKTSAPRRQKIYQLNSRYLRYMPIFIICLISISIITIFIQKRFINFEMPTEKKVYTKFEEFKREVKEIDRKISSIPREEDGYLIIEKEIKKEKHKHLEIVGKKKKSPDMAMIPKQSYRQEINQSQIEKLKEMLNSYDRYVDNKDGTITDKVSGLMWSLANSYLELGEYVDYAGAENYVRSLRTGGYSDWRLPTTGELAGIYANKPFFPNIGAKWYWSSDIYHSGWDVVVSIIKPENKEVFIRKYTKQTDEGAVHAVRP